jgi:phospholipid/cholesterol/gamma-HCH transport system substrate-binding protein
MSDRQQRIRLGLFVIGALLLFAGLIIFFGGAPDWLKSTHKYTIIFSDAPGLQPGTPVRKSGVKVGEVSSIQLNDETGQVKVGVRLNSDFTPRTSDEPTVTRGLIVGDTAIDFVPRAPEKALAGDPIPPNSVLQGVSPFNTKVLIDQATSVVPEAQRSLVQVRKSLEAIEKIGPQAETTLREIGELARASREFIPDLKRTNDGLRDLFGNSGDLGPSLAAVVPELRKTLEETRYFLKTGSFWVEEAGVTFKRQEPRLVKALESLTQTTERLNEIMSPENQKSITEILKNVKLASGRFDRLTMSADDFMKDGRGTLKTLNSTLAQTEQAVAELRQATRPLAERAPRIMQNLDNSIELLNRTMADARELMRVIGQSEGSLQKFIADPTLYNNLNETMAMLQKMMPRFDRILKDVEVFADKIARHPESLGIGGAIRPSAGLKEGPPSTSHFPKP